MLYKCVVQPLKIMTKYEWINLAGTGGKSTISGQEWCMEIAKLVVKIILILCLKLSLHSDIIELMEGSFFSMSMWKFCC